METDFRVLDAMTKSPVSVKPHITVRECAQLMKDKNVGSVVVMEDNGLMGVLTESDLVRKIISENKTLDTPVKSIMCNNFTTIPPHAKLFDAINMMAQLDVRHLPVLHEGEFLGFLTAKDVLKIEPALFEILIDSVELREEHRKPIYRYEDEVEVQDYNVLDDDD